MTTLYPPVIPVDPRQPTGIYIPPSSYSTNVARSNDLLNGDNISVRTTFITTAHIYNLRNQTWAIPRLIWANGNDTTVADVIVQFAQRTGGFPSNADSTIPFIYNDAASHNNKNALRFNVDDCVANPPGTGAAPRGYFIIDAMERGASRMAACTALQYQYRLSYPVVGLPLDKTPGGPSVIAEYAGRIFYGGFSGSIIQQDKHSPKMSSYVLFSQVVKDTSGIDACYQEADPTSGTDAALVATDGGFIRVEGAFSINGLVALGPYLFIFAENGVWQLGGTTAGFTATAYSLSKLTNKGSSSPGSIVLVGNALVYWSQDAIYTISQNQFGDYVVNNITKNKIQNFYNSISPFDKKYATGIYDSYQLKVSWLFSNRDTSTDTTKELILDMQTGAYTLFEISNLGGQKYPMVLEGIQTNPFSLTSTTQDVVAGTDSVLVSSDVVQATVSDSASSIVEIKYLCAVQTSPTIGISFGSYKEPTHYDWKAIDGAGVDAPSYLLTGKVSGGDAQRKKAVPYITFHFVKTEDGFTEVSPGVYEPTNQSSCLVQAQWGWTNSAASNKWGKQFQAYRHRRHWTPSNLAGGFDDGYAIVDSKSKLRGNGPAISMLLQSEPGKHLSIYGWSTQVEAVANV